MWNSILRNILLKSLLTVYKSLPSTSKNASRNETSASLEAAPLSNRKNQFHHSANTLARINRTERIDAAQIATPFPSNKRQKSPPSIKQLSVCLARNLGDYERVRAVRRREPPCQPGGCTRKSPRRIGDATSYRSGTFETV